MLKAPLLMTTSSIRACSTAWTTPRPTALPRAIRLSLRRNPAPLSRIRRCPGPHQRILRIQLRYPRLRPLRRRRRPPCPSSRQPPKPRPQPLPRTLHSWWDVVTLAVLCHVLLPAADALVGPHSSQAAKRKSALRLRSAGALVDIFTATLLMHVRV